jgi:6-pyruvoyltetrahydropterin/6-carboxytetrahydropterin synthase
MFAITAEAVFSAAHAIRIRGELEVLHGHDWRVTARMEGPRLDEDGLLWDFHALEADLAEVIKPFRNANLNQTAPFDQVNPTAEEVARHIGERLGSMLASRLARYPQEPSAWPAGVRLAKVTVTEAPGCAAEYVPG